MFGLPDALAAGAVSGLVFTAANGVWELLLARRTRAHVSGERAVVEARVTAAEAKAEEGRGAILARVDAVRGEVLARVEAVRDAVLSRIEDGGSEALREAREEFVREAEEREGALRTAAEQIEAARADVERIVAERVEAEIKARVAKHFSDPEAAAEAGRKGVSAREAKKLSRAETEFALIDALGPEKVAIWRKAAPDSFDLIVGLGPAAVDRIKARVLPNGGEGGGELVAFASGNGARARSAWDK